ncbi:MAG TPA: TonB-dependent receptor [Bacteroidia bacterium]|nr:TonB-dependent receptor [Bacteroidia bacterium]
MKLYINTILFLVIGPLNFLLAQSDKVILSGIIKEKESGETLPGVSISCDSLKVGVQTNTYGFYSLSLPKGKHRIKVSALGFSKKDTTIFFSENIRIDFGVEQGVKLREVVVSADEKIRISEESQMSVINIPIQQIKDIPALLGEKDVLKVIQLMPGVQKGSEGSSGIYVRGGGPDQNLIILDDATVYNAYHLFGFFSLFNGDALKSVELVKGGFPASYGGRLSSVINMQMKEGNQEKFHGEAGIGLLSSRLVLEGPLLKKKSSFLVSARRTYIDAFIYPFLPPDQKGGYYFYDLNAKLNYTLTDKDRLYLSGYFGKDKFYFNSKGDGYKMKGNLNWGNATGTLRWNHIYNGKLFSNTSAIFTNYQLGIGSREEFDSSYYDLEFSSAIRDNTIKHDFDFFPNNKHHVKFGGVSIFHRFRPSAVVVKSSDVGSAGIKVRSIYSVESGLYVEDDWKITGLLKANIGFRASHYYINNKSFLKPEPRVSARYTITDKSSIKASYALMNQYLHLLSSTGVSLPTDLWVPATANLRPMQSQQWALGWAQELPKGINLTIEGYYKKMNDISFYKEGASFLLIDDPEGAEGINWEKNITQGKGWSYGGEFLLQKEKGKWSGWIGYTLSWTFVQFDSINFGKKFYPRYDRRHDISIVNIYKFNDRIKLSCTWVYGTGNAITLPIAQYNAAPHDPAANDGYNQDSFLGYNSNFRNDYGEKNGFRMAPYHRLDVGLQFTKVKKRYTRTFEISFYNAYNRWNPFFYFIERGATTSQNKLMQITLFPILPSVSWSWKF